MLVPKCQRALAPERKKEKNEQAGRRFVEGRGVDGTPRGKPTVRKDQALFRWWRWWEFWKIFEVVVL